MSEADLVLAVYGTLRSGGRNHAFLAGSRYLGTGAVLGRLHEMPHSSSREYAYPALVADGSSPVVVELYRIPDAATLAAADELEAFDPTDPASSEYVRREVEIIDGPVAAASVYVYNGPPADMGDEIPDGDWLAHLARHRD